MSEEFLSRWSRRKQQARRGTVEGEIEAPAVKSPAPAEAPEPVLTPEEIAKLPKIDELTAESDITVFLRRGVPAPLRNAALRRMWLLDPAIRDFAGHARDYDYDWNTPGGAPGHGPLEPGDDVGAMVRKIFGERGESRPGDRTADAEHHASKDIAHQETAVAKTDSTPSDQQQEQRQPGPEPDRCT